MKFCLIPFKRSELLEPIVDEVSHPLKALEFIEINRLASCLVASASTTVEVSDGKTVPLPPSNNPKNTS